MKKVEKEAMTKIKTMKKLRFLSKFGRKQYIDKMGREAVEVMKIKLNMVSYIDGNYGRVETCKLCNEGISSTEHIFECKEIQLKKDCSVDMMMENDEGNL